jgi:hypothetical protein
LQEQEEAIKALQTNLQQAQNRMKKFADAKRTERKFKVGDWSIWKCSPTEKLPWDWEILWN